MHENAVYYAIQHAIRRLFPDWEKTAEGRDQTEKLIIEIMTEIKESGIRYVNAGGK